MALVPKTYKFRLSPSDEQKILLAKHFGSCRFVYNHFLAKCKESYLLNKKTLMYNQNAAELKALKKTDDYIWLKEINSQSLQYSLQGLDHAYARFFRKQAAFPVFKSRSDKQAFRVPQSVYVEDGLLWIPKFKTGIQMNMHREMSGRILFATVSKTPTGKYFVSITCECEHEPLPLTGSEVGIDTGIKEIAILSDGTRYENHKPLKKRLKKIKYEQRQLSKKKKGSNSRLKQKSKLARVHEKVTNTRMDYLHKVSTEIVKSHDVICIEDLAVKNLMKNHCLAQAFADAALGTFYGMLQYKAAWNGKKVVKIDRFFPSTKMCNVCNYINQDLTLKDREWTCPDCNTHHDRDLNGSINIKNQGLTILSGSGTESDTKQKQVEALSIDESMKPEAPPSTKVVVG